MKYIVDEDSIIKLNGVEYTMAKFAVQFNVDSIDKAILVAQSLVDKNKAGVVQRITKEQKKFNKIGAELDITASAEDIYEQEDLKRMFIAENKRGEKERFGLEIDFPNRETAEAFQAILWNKHMIRDTEVATKYGGFSILKIDNITDSDYKTIEGIMKITAIKDTGLALTEKGLSAITDSTEFLVNQLALPGAKIGISALGSLMKTVAKTTVKLGSVIGTTGVNAIKETYHDIKNDPDVIKGKATCIEAKDFILQKTMGNIDTGSSRLRVIK